MYLPGLGLGVVVGAVNKKEYLSSSIISSTEIDALFKKMWINERHSEISSFSNYRPQEIVTKIIYFNIF